MKFLVGMFLLTIIFSCGKKDVLGQNPEAVNTPKLISFEEFYSRIQVKPTCENGIRRVTSLKEQNVGGLNSAGDDLKYSYDLHGYVFENGSYQLLLKVYKYSLSRNQVTENLDPIVIDGQYSVNKATASLELLDDSGAVIAEIIKPEFDNNNFLSVKVKINDIPTFNGVWGSLDNRDNLSFAEVENNFHLPLGMSENCE